MEKKATLIHSTVNTIIPQQHAIQTNSFKLLDELKTNIFKTLSQLHDHYRIYFPSEPSFSQKLTTMIKNYGILGERRKVIEDIAELPSIIYPFNINDLRNQIVRDDDKVRHIQEELLIKNKNLIYPEIKKLRRNLLLENDSEVSEDLRQAGIIGLMIAIDKFDISKGYKFSTYATWWIKQKVQRLIEKQCRIISIPTGKKEGLGIIQKAQKQLSEKDRKDPHMLASIIKNMSLRSTVKKTMTPQAIGEILEIQHVVFESLDEPVGDDKENTRLEFIPSREVPPGHEKRIKELIEVLSTIPELTNIELQTIAGYYGLIDDRPLSYYDLGKQQSKSHEYMRRIHMKGLKKIKDALEKDSLLDRDLRSFI